MCILRLFFGFRRGGGGPGGGGALGRWEDVFVRFQSLSAPYRLHFPFPFLSAMAEKKSLKRQSSMSEDFGVFLHNPEKGTYCGTRNPEAWRKNGCLPLGPDPAYLAPFHLLPPHSSEVAQPAAGIGHG